MKGEEEEARQRMEMQSHEEIYQKLLDEEV